MNGKELETAYQAQLKSLLVLQQYIAKNKKNPGDPPGIPGADVFWDGKVLKFVVPEVLPISKYNTAQVKLHWMGYMSHAYRKAKLDIKMDYALCVIVVFTPKGKPWPWDADNRAAANVINALWKLRIIEDDNIHHLTYMVAGKIDNERPRTEIYVIEKKNLESILGAVGLKTFI